MPCCFLLHILECVIPYRSKTVKVRLRARQKNCWFRFPADAGQNPNGLLETIVYLSGIEVRWSVWPIRLVFYPSGPDELVAWPVDNHMDLNITAVLFMDLTDGSSNFIGDRPKSFTPQWSVDQFFHRSWLFLLEFVVHLVLHPTLSPSGDCDESWVRDYYPKDFRHGGVPSSHR